MADILEQKLSINDLSELIEHAPVGCKWNELGLQLNIDPNKLNNIDNDNQAVTRKVTAMYETWLQIDPNATRKQLIDALRKTSVERDALASHYERYIIEGSKNKKLIVQIVPVI